ncbi:FAD-dependent oxidoreductase [Streptomyces sp. NPDC050988]|uniref:FAD-dependent oxidoreductase n=1 Tax=Streptomyces sp. NPDC050988 TaxID=3365637 RepID=UPI00379BD1DF
MDNNKVVVVGAGPVGLITALGLARAGVEVLVLEREPALATSPRAIVYYGGVLGGLDRLGLLDDALKAGVRTTTVQFLVRRTGERIAFDHDVLEGHVPYPYNVNLGQDRMADIALRHLLRLPGTEVRFGTAVTGIEQDADGVTVTAEADGVLMRLRAGWVVGADGAGSRVRELLGLDFEGTTWPERFVATNIRFPYDQHGYADANMVFDPEYGAVIAKIDGKGLWRCTYSEDAALPVESVHERIPAYFAATLPGDQRYELVQYSPYKMHQRAASAFRSGRVVLAGDAAHVTNPTGGLGLTSGLFDSFVLSEALAAVVRGESGAEVLDRYAEDRRRAFQEYASPLASALKQLVFGCRDETMLEGALTGLRRAAADPELQVRQLMVSQPLETPSLLTPTA